MIKMVPVFVLISRVTAASALDVYVYDLANTPSSVLAEAQRVLAAIFRVGGIELRWHIGLLSSPEANRVVLTEPAQPGREHELACAARRDIALVIAGNGAVAPTPTALGFANPFAPEGVNATILSDRVMKVADKHGVATGSLLAHVIAHEIGHVLLRSNNHRKYGLMAGDWDTAQYQRITRAGMFFEKADAARMKANIAGEGCSHRGARATVIR